MIFKHMKNGIDMKFKQNQQYESVECTVVVVVVDPFIFIDYVSIAMSMTCYCNNQCTLLKVCYV